MYFWKMSTFPGYVISREGVVKDQFDKILATYINGDGYHGVSLKSPDGKWTTYGIHRLVAFKFIRNDKPDVRDQVNHFDMDKSNNNVSNLDWVSNEENLMHASLFVKEGRKDRLLIKSNVTGEEQLCGGLHDAEVITGVTIREIWDSLLGHCTLRDWEITYRQYGEKIPPALVLSRGGSMADAPVFVKDVATGETTFYPTIGKAAKALGVIPTAVRNAITENGKVRSLRTRYLVIREDGTFPEVTLGDLVAMASNIAKSVAGFNMEKGTWIIVGSVNDFIRYSELTKKTVRGQLARHPIGSAGNWVFTYVADSSSEAIIRITNYIKLRYRDVQIDGL